jgi:hypothetical protein
MGHECGVLSAECNIRCGVSGAGCKPFKIFLSMPLALASG